MTKITMTNGQELYVKEPFTVVLGLIRRREKFIPVSTNTSKMWLNVNHIVSIRGEEHDTN